VKYACYNDVVSVQQVAPIHWRAPLHQNRPWCISIGGALIYTDVFAAMLLIPFNMLASAASLPVFITFDLAA
jgi:hypothetical protein